MTEQFTRETLKYTHVQPNSDFITAAPFNYYCELLHVMDTTRPIQKCLELYMTAVF
jgi:hypothetical protein